MEGCGKVQQGADRVADLSFGVERVDTEFFGECHQVFREILLQNIAGRQVDADLDITRQETLINEQVGGHAIEHPLTDLLDDA